MNWLLKLFSPRFGGRHKDWGKLRKCHISVFPRCAVCNKKGFIRANDVHHIIPVSVDSFKEMDMDNLITLCRKHHLLFGHLNYWRSWNKNVVEDARYMLVKIFNRP